MKKGAKATRKRGRPKKERPVASKESYDHAKWLIKAYPEDRSLVASFEKRMKTLLRILKKSSIKGFPLVIGIDDRYKSFPLGKSDKEMIADYLDAKETVYLVEYGISQMEEGERKEIATEQIINGIQPEEIRRVRQIDDSTRYRAIQLAIKYIARQYDLLKEWKESRMTGG